MNTEKILNQMSFNIEHNIWRFWVELLRKDHEDILQQKLYIYICTFFEVKLHRYKIIVDWYMNRIRISLNPLSFYSKVEISIAFWGITDVSQLKCLPAHLLTPFLGISPPLYSFRKIIIPNLDDGFQMGWEMKLLEIKHLTYTIVKKRN